MARHIRILTFTALLALTMSKVLAAPPADYGELVFEDHFERSESQELNDEPGNGWTTSSDKTAPGHKQVDLRDGARAHAHARDGEPRCLHAPRIRLHRRDDRDAVQAR